MASFGRLLHWVQSADKSRILLNVMVLTPDRVPHSIVVSQGTTLGGNGRSWSVPFYILGEEFLDVFPSNEDPVPADGNPHPAHGHIHVNPNA